MVRRIAIGVVALLLALGAPMASLGEDEGPAGPSPAFAGGDGSVANPYLISNVTELQNMSANLTAHYRLAGDIDASATSGWNGGAGFEPVGSAASKFNGSLDGDGHTISGLVMDRPGQDYVGLFGYLDGAEVHDLSVAGASVEGRNRVGALCGQSTTGSLANCTASGTVVGNDYVGGVAGVLTGALNDSGSSASVSGYRYVGGLVGHSNGDVARCSSRGRVTFTSSYAGGLLGYIAGGTVTDSVAGADLSWGNGYNAYQVGVLAGFNGGRVTSCRSEGDLTLVGEGHYISYAGGFIGQNDGVASYCGSTSTVVCTISERYDLELQNIGGFVGYNRGTVNCSFTEGPVFVTGTTGRAMMFSISSIGGFAGSNYGTLSSSFSTGTCTVLGSAEDMMGIYYVGGLCGHNGATVSDCYSTGNVHATVSGTYGTLSYCGGLVGSTSRTMVNSYSTGWVSAIAQGTNAVTRYIGGLIGGTNVAATACFWDVQTSGTTTGVGSGTTAGTSGNTTAEMKTRATFADAGWDMNDTWLMIENVTYPRLQCMYHRPLVELEDGLTFAEDAPMNLPADVTVSEYPVPNRETSRASTTDAPWLSWNDTLGAFTGTPGNDEVGTYWLNLTVEDACDLSGWANVTFTVANVNDDPVITTDDVTVATEDEPYSVAYNATDVDPTGDTLTWTLSTGADWLDIDPDTGLLEGTPGNEDVGRHQATVSVTDGNGGLDATTFIIEVVNVNDDPIITTPPHDTAVQGMEYDSWFAARDEDPTEDRLTWHLTTDAEWLTLEGTLLHGIPGNEDVGVWTVNVSVTDGRGGLAFRDFELRVWNFNDPPVIARAHVTEATEDEEYSVDYDAVDPDPSDHQKWYLDTDAEWLSMDQDTGVLSGTPSNDDVGVWSVLVRVADTEGGRDEATFFLTVADANDAPVITTEADTTATEDRPYLLLLEATDIDPGRDTLVWSLDTDAGWLHLGGAALTGVPGNDDVGVYQVSVMVDDGRGGSDSLDFTITVANVNDPPAIVNSPPDAMEDEPYGFAMEAVDVDAGSTLEWSIKPEGGWLSVAPDVGELSGTPGDADVGRFLFVLTVTDGIASVSKAFTIDVSNVNDAPEWKILPDNLELEHGTPLLMAVQAVDVDGDEVQYYIAAEPAADGLTVGVISGDVAWYKPRPGTYLVTVTASDGEEDVDTEFELVIKKAPVEDEGMGAAPLYAVIAVLLVVVVLLVLRTVMAGPPAAEEAPEDDTTGDEDTGVEEEEAAEEEEEG